MLDTVWGSLSQLMDERAYRPTPVVVECHDFRSKRRESRGFGEQPTGNLYPHRNFPEKRIQTSVYPWFPYNTERCQLVNPHNQRPSKR